MWLSVALLRQTHSYNFTHCVCFEYFSLHLAQNVFKATLISLQGIIATSIAGEKTFDKEAKGSSIESRVPLLCPRYLIFKPKVKPALSLVEDKERVLSRKRLLRACLVYL